MGWLKKYYAIIGFLACLIMSQGALASLNDGLTEYFSMDNDNVSGTLTYGLFGLNGTSTQVEFNQSGIHGQSVKIFNSTSRIEVADLTNRLVFQGNKTICFWYNNSVATAFILSKRDSSLNTNYQFYFSGTTYTISNSTTEIFTSATLISNNVFHHICNVLSVNHTRVYLDNNDFGNYLFLDNNKSSSLFIGNVYSLGLPIKGSMDEIMFWNRSLSASEVLELYNSSFGSFYPFPADVIPPEVPVNQTGDLIKGIGLNKYDMGTIPNVFFLFCLIVVWLAAVIMQYTLKIPLLAIFQFIMALFIGIILSSVHIILGISFFMVSLALLLTVYLS